LLLDEAEGFQTHWWNATENLRPLVFLFRCDPKIKTGIQVGLIMKDERRQYGTWQYPNTTALSKSACSPERRALSKWPAKIDIEIKVPLENPELIKTIESITGERVEVAPGITWYVDRQRGEDRSGSGPPRGGLTAAVFETPSSITSLTNYYATVWKKGQQEPLSNDYATIIELKPGVLSTIRVSRPIDGPQAIEKVEFHRQRFRRERINNIQTHLDLLPADDDPDLKAPAPVDDRF
jgi:hypothetical protein